MSRWKIFAGFIWLLTVSEVSSYPSGAPVSTCKDMVPRHLNYLPQTDPPPYYIQPSISRVSSGDRLKVMLSSQDEFSFTGFMVQARTPLGGDEPIGGFSALPHTAKAITCGPNAKSTATHRDRIPHKSLELEWEAPSEYEGPLVFNATFVQNGAVFWVGVQSEPIHVVKRSLPDDYYRGGISSTKPPVRLTTIPNYTLRPELKSEGYKDPIYNDCDKTKACFGIPDNCVQSQSCLVLATILVKGDVYEFELLSKSGSKGAPKYVALGLSDDQKMVTLKQARFADGSLYCNFIRDSVTTVAGKEYDLVNDKFYLLLASGTSLKDNGKRVGWHDIGYQSSSSARYLSDTGSLTGSSNILYRLHGAFMMAAWVGFASVGILLARYFKMTWVGKRFCGKDQWFTWHRTFMVMTWSLTVSAIVIIFVEIKGWYSETSNPHAILGCITTGLAFIQPFGAALRPTPDSPKRPIFNWLHWLVGNCAHILAIVTIFFAVKLNKAALPDWTDWILVSYVAFHVFMHLLFSVAGCFSEGQMEKRVNDFPMKDMSSARGPLHGLDRKRDAPHSYFRKFLLAIYLTVLIILTVILEIIVVLAPIEDHWTFKEAKKLVMDN